MKNNRDFNSALKLMHDVMKSYAVDQTNCMNNINTLVKNRNNEIDVIDKVKIEISKLSHIHSQMKECESFILQMAKQEEEIYKSKKTDSEISSKNTGESS